MAQNRRVPAPRNRMRGLTDYDMSWCPSETPADGFSMNAALRYLPYRSFALYLGQLDELRCCRGQYRNRDFVIPFDHSITIEEFGTLKYQQQVHPGTVMWGFNFSALNPEVSLSDFTIQIKDLCQTYQFFYGDGTDATALRPTAAADLFPVLCEPYVIEKAPGATGGLLDVTIGNKTNAAQSCQLVIRCAEPCAVMGRGYGPMPGDLPLPGTPVQRLPTPSGGAF